MSFDHFPREIKHVKNHTQSLPLLSSSQAEGWWLNKRLYHKALILSCLPTDEPRKRLFSNTGDCARRKIYMQVSFPFWGRNNGESDDPALPVCTIDVRAVGCAPWPCINFTLTFKSLSYCCLPLPQKEFKNSLNQFQPAWGSGKYGNPFDFLFHHQ